MFLRQFLSYIILPGANCKVFKSPFLDDKALYLSHLPRVEWNHGKKEEEMVAEAKKTRAKDIKVKLLAWVFKNVPLENFKETSRHDYFRQVSFYVFPTSDQFKLQTTLLESKWRGDGSRQTIEETTHLIDLKF